MRALPRWCPHSARRWYADSRLPRRFDDRRATNADVTLVRRCLHLPALSKRTDLNAVVTQVNNNANAQVLPGGNGYPRRRDGVRRQGRNHVPVLAASQVLDFGLVDFSLLGTLLESRSRESDAAFSFDDGGRFDAAADDRKV